MHVIRTSCDCCVPAVKPDPECNFDHPQDCPKCGSSDIDSDYHYHDGDFTFRAIHMWNCWDCLYGEVTHCTNKNHRGLFDENYREYLEMF